MKLTKQQLKQIIKEELEKALNEGEVAEPGPYDAAWRQHQARRKERVKAKAKAQLDADWQQALDAQDPKRIASMLNHSYYKTNPGLAAYVQDWQEMAQMSPRAEQLADEWELKLPPEGIAPFAQKVLSLVGGTAPKEKN